jgi:hypothetical protein
MLRIIHTLFKNDKEIGKVIIRNYSISKQEWDNYNKQIINAYSSNFNHMDSLFSNNNHSIGNNYSMETKETIGNNHLIGNKYSTKPPSVKYLGFPLGLLTDGK